MPSQTFTTLILVHATAIAALAISLQRYHARLRSQITSRTISHVERKAAAAGSVATPASLESLPQDLLDHPRDYRIVHIRDSIPILSSDHAIIDSEPNIDDASNVNPRTLFTTLLRRNMRFFATYLPQAYLMRYLLAITPEQKASFTAQHLDNLAFEPGNLACGFYRVLVRRELRCEMGLTAPAKGLPESSGGRMIVSIADVSGERAARGWELRTETMQWVRVGGEEGEGAEFVLPLERRPMRWLHELASWGLLVEGAGWLQEGTQCKDRE